MSCFGRKKKKELNPYEQFEVWKESIINFNKKHKDIMSTQTFDNEIIFCQANTFFKDLTFLEIEKKLIMIETNEKADETAKKEAKGNKEI